MEEKLDYNNVQLCQVIPNAKRGFSILSESELKSAIDRLTPTETELAVAGSAGGSGTAPASTST